MRNEAMSHKMCNEAMRHKECHVKLELLTYACGSIVVLGTVRAHVFRSIVVLGTVSALGIHIASSAKIRNMMACRNSPHV